METLSLLGSPAVDWATLTTYNPDAGDFLLSQLRADSGAMGQDIKPAKRMQYTGEGGPDWFVGFGDQGGKRHYLCQVWGGRSHGRALEWLRDATLGPYLKCTRIDVQLTSAQPYTADLPNLGRVLRTCKRDEWLFTGRAPRVDFYDNADGLHTLYIGSRKSERMIRAYNKKFEDGIRVRFEVEYKGSLAAGVAEKVTSEGEPALMAVLDSEVSFLPKMCKVIIPMLRSIELLGADRMTVDYSQPDLTATMNWIYSAVVPAVERMMKTSYSYEVVEALQEAMEPDIINPHKIAKFLRKLRD